MSRRSLTTKKQRARSGSPPPVVEAGRRYFTRRRAVLLIGVVAAVFLGIAAIKLGMEWQARRELSARRPEQALKWLQAASRLGRDNAEIEYLTARAYRKQGENYERFRAHLERAGQLGLPPERVQMEQVLAFAQAGHMRFAEPHLGRLLFEHPNEGAEICEAFVTGYVLLGQLSQAVMLLDAWIKEFPEDPHPYFLRGQISKRRADRRPSESEFQRAYEDFRRAYELDDSNVAALYESALMLIELQRPQEALNDLSRIGDDERYRVPAAIARARCLRLLGDSAAARQVLETATAAADRNADAWFELGQLDVENGDFSLAAAAFDRASELRPRDGRTRFALGNALRLAGDSEAAEEHLQWFAESEAALDRREALRKHLAQEPHDVAARCELGSIELEFGVPEIGALWLKSALQEDPDCQEARRLLARYDESRADDGEGFTGQAGKHRNAASTPHPSDRPSPTTK